jgi:hypothetical protein
MIMVLVDWIHPRILHHQTRITLGNVEIDAPIVDQSLFGEVMHVVMVVKGYAQTTFGRWHIDHFGGLNLRYVHTVGREGFVQWYVWVA